MSEIDVSAIQDAEVEYMSASVCELGDQAGRLTWQNCNNFAEARPLVTDENRDDIRSHFYEYGAWERAEIDAWSDTELSAMVWQEAAASYREFIGLCKGNLRTHYRLMHEGTISSRLSVGRLVRGKRKLFFYLGM